MISLQSSVFLQGCWWQGKKEGFETILALYSPSSIYWLWRYYSIQKNEGSMKWSQTDTHLRFYEEEEEEECSS